MKKYNLKLCVECQINSKMSVRSDLCADCFNGLLKKKIEE